MQRGIERALLDLENFVGAEFDGFGDGVAVGGAEQERAEDEQVEGALEHFDALEFVFSRHSRWRIMMLTSNVKGREARKTRRKEDGIGEAVFG
jgi:hypothetical protein